MQKTIKLCFFMILFSLFCSLFSSCKLIQRIQERKIANLENMISDLEEEYTPIKFKMEKKNDSETTLRVLFLDLNGKTIKNEKVTLEGTEVHFDFQVIKLAAGKKNKKNKSLTTDQFMFYPYKIYTEKIEPQNGIDLCNIYNENDFPAIFNGFEEFLTEENKKFENAYKEKISQTFVYILNDEMEMLTNQYGSAVHDMQGISEFKKGYVYSVICHPHTGGIEIRRQ